MRCKAPDCIALLLCLLVAGCGEGREAQRIPSPDGKVEAVILTHDAGATTGIAYHVALVPRGGAPDLDESVLVADKVSALSVSWQDATHLSVHVGQARIFHFTNFWQSREVDDFAHVVRLSLLEGNW